VKENAILRGFATVDYWAGDLGAARSGDTPSCPASSRTSSGQDLILSVTQRYWSSAPRCPRHKEVIVSFALIEVRSADEALELSRRFWKIAGDGEDDIRQVFGPVGVVTPDIGTAAAHHAIEGCGGWSRPG